MNTLKELQDLFITWGIKDCYVTPHMLDIGFEKGYIYVDTIPDGFRECLDAQFNGLIHNGDLKLRTCCFGQGDRYTRDYRLPNFIKDSLPMEHFTGSRKEQFIHYLKQYNVKNCYVTPHLDLNQKNPQGDIIVDTKSESLGDELYWLYVDYVNDLTDDYYVNITFSDFKEDCWCKPNFVVKGVFHDADFS